MVTRCAKVSLPPAEARSRATPTAPGYRMPVSLRPRLLAPPMACHQERRVPHPCQAPSAAATRASAGGMPFAASNAAAAGASASTLSCHVVRHPPHGGWRPTPGVAFGDHRPRRFERVAREEPVDVAHHAHLGRETELVVHGASPGDQIAFDVVEEEEPLSLGAGRLLGEFPVRIGLLISQKLRRHGWTAASPGARPAIFPRTPAEPWQLPCPVSRWAAMARWKTLPATA